MTGQDWLTFLRVARPDLDRSRLGWILTLDPGETTGWSSWHEGELVEVGQEVTGQNPGLMAEFIKAMDEQLVISRIVYEEYRIRSSTFKTHVGSPVVTIQHIGAIKVAADMLDIPIYAQTPGMAKGFATDQKLKRWGLYQTGMKHANDAVRHGIYHILFHSGRTRENA